VSIPTEHLSLFKADWIGDPDRLKALARRRKYNDLFTWMSKSRSWVWTASMSMVPIPRPRSSGSTESATRSAWGFEIVQDTASVSVAIRTNA
jgi:hypothetical protein